MSRILLVEDTFEIYELVSRTLRASYHLTWAKTIGQAFELLESKEFDLILLDIGLPDGDGYRACSMLRSAERHQDVPVIFLSGRSHSQDKVAAFSVGGDDYVVKPFHPHELKARIQAKLRRRNLEREASQRIRIGDIEIDRDTQKILAHQGDTFIEMGLTSTEFKILLYLAKYPNHLISRDRILKALWGENVHVHCRSIDTHISKLRKKLGSNATYITSVHGAGYRFVVPEIGLPFAEFTKKNIAPSALGHRSQSHPQHRLNAKPKGAPHLPTSWLYLTTANWRTSSVSKKIKTAPSILLSDVR